MPSLGLTLGQSPPPTTILPFVQVGDRPSRAPRAQLSAEPPQGRGLPAILRAGQLLREAATYPRARGWFTYGSVGGSWQPGLRGGRPLAAAGGKCGRAGARSCAGPAPHPGEAGRRLHTCTHSRATDTFWGSNRSADSSAGPLKQNEALGSFKIAKEIP